MSPQASAYAAISDQLVGRFIENGRLYLKKSLAVGAFGAILLAHDIRQPTNPSVVVKCIAVPSADSNCRDQLFLTREIYLHEAAQGHPNVLRLHRWFVEDALVFLVLDYYPEGDLFGMITERQMFVGRDDLIRHAALQLVDAFQHLHARGIFHRDLKPENVLCSSVDGGIHLTLADFGLATNEEISQEWGVGSTYYMSPECLGQPDPADQQRFAYSAAANDVWAVGILLINLTCGRNPWKRADISDGTYAGFVGDPDFLLSILPISLGFHHILKAIFAVDMEERITLPELKDSLLRLRRFNLSEPELNLAPEAVRDAAGPLIAYYAAQRQRFDCVPAYPARQEASDWVGAPISNWAASSKAVIPMDMEQSVESRFSTDSEDSFTSYALAIDPYNPPSFPPSTTLLPGPHVGDTLVHPSKLQQCYDDQPVPASFHGWKGDNGGVDTPYHRYHHRKPSIPSSVLSGSSGSSTVSSFPHTPSINSRSSWEEYRHVVRNGMINAISEDVYPDVINESGFIGVGEVGGVGFHALDAEAKGPSSCSCLGNAPQTTYKAENDRPPLSADHVLATHPTTDPPRPPVSTLGGGRTLRAKLRDILAGPNWLGRAPAQSSSKLPRRNVKRRHA